VRARSIRRTCRGRTGSSSSGGRCGSRRAATSKGFVASEQAMAVVAAAKMWGVRPSQLLAMEDPVLSLNFDLAMTARVNQVIEDGGEVRGPVNRVEL
jgi:hypothetical protein